MANKPFSRRYLLYTPCLGYGGARPPTLPQSASHHAIAGRTPPFPHAYRARSASSATRRRDGDPVAPPSNEKFHAGYHTLDEINDFVLDLADAYPRQVFVISLGHSGEGREMFALEITTGASASQVSHDLKSQVVLNKKFRRCQATLCHPYHRRSACSRGQNFFSRNMN